MGRNETERYFGSALGLMWKLNAFFGSASRLQWIDVHKQWVKLSRTRSCFGGDLWLKFRHVRHEGLRETLQVH